MFVLKWLFNNVSSWLKQIMELQCLMLVKGGVNMFLKTLKPTQIPGKNLKQLRKQLICE